MDGLATALGTSSSANTVDTLTGEILQEYPLENFNSPDEALAAVTTDGTFSCTALVTDELLSIYVPTFGYELADQNAPMLFLPPVSFPYKATHTDELQFLFTDLAGLPSQLSADETTLATTMKSYWTDFAAQGNPNDNAARGTANWPRFSILSPQIQSLVAPRPRARVDFAQDHHCVFWETILVQGAIKTVLGAFGG